MTKPKHKPRNSPNKPHRQQTPDGIEVRRIVALHAATVEGFRYTDMPDAIRPTAYKVMTTLLRNGLVFQGKAGPKIRHFASAAAADAWQKRALAERDASLDSCGRVRNSRTPAQPKPAANAITVYPDDYKLTSQAPPPPRFWVDVPRQRIGTASWLKI